VVKPLLADFMAGGFQSMPASADP